MKHIIVLSLIFACLLLSPAAAIELHGLGGNLGWTAVSGDVGNTYVLRLLADLGPVLPGLYLVPDLSRWSWSKADSDQDLKKSSLFLSANGRYFLPMINIEPVIPYVGGGLGLHRLTRKTVQGSWESESTDYDIGLNILAGATYLTTPFLSLVGEVRYTIVPGYSHFSLTVGATYLIYR